MSLTGLSERRKEDRRVKEEVVVTTQATKGRQQKKPGRQWKKCGTGINQK